MLGMTLLCGRLEKQRERERVGRNNRDKRWRVGGWSLYVWSILQTDNIRFGLLVVVNTDKDNKRQLMDKWIIKQLWIFISGFGFPANPMTRCEGGICRHRYRKSLIQFNPFRPGDCKFASQINLLHKFVDQRLWQMSCCCSCVICN